FADDSPAGAHAFFRPWLLWDRCFDLAPDVSKQFALGLWEHAVKEGKGAPHDAGFYLRTWSVAYAQTKDVQFLQAIEVLLARLQNPSQSTTVPAGGEPSHRAIASTLSLAIYWDGA